MHYGVKRTGILTSSPVPFPGFSDKGLQGGVGMVEGRLISAVSAE